MLVLSRSIEQVIMIGDEIEVKVVEVRGGKVKLGINAPKNVSVHRREVYDRIAREKLKDQAVKKTKAHVA